MCSYKHLRSIGIMELPFFMNVIMFLIQTVHNYRQEKYVNNYIIYNSNVFDNNNP